MASLISVKVDRWFEPDQVAEMVDWLFHYRVQLIRFSNGQVGRPEDLLLGGVRTKMHVSATLHFHCDDDAVLFKMKFS